MTQAEIFNIEIGDKLYVNQKIHKRIFNSRWFLVYKPDKFYTVFQIDKTETYIRLTTSSEVGCNKIIVFKKSVGEPPFTCLKTLGKLSQAEVPVSIPIVYMQHFNLIKKLDYEMISSVDYFAEL